MTIKTMHRKNDTQTAIAAAEKILPRINDLQRRILATWRRYHRRTFGKGATDGEIESLPEFADCRPSTVRKRRLDLERKGYLRATEQKRAGMTVYVPVSDTQLREALRANRENWLF